MGIAKLKVSYFSPYESFRLFFKLLQRIHALSTYREITFSQNDSYIFHNICP